MCMDFSASLYVVDSYQFLYLPVFYFVEEFFYAILYVSGDCPYSVLFCFLIVTSFPLFPQLLCSYLPPEDTAPSTESHRFSICRSYSPN